MLDTEYQTHLHSILVERFNKEGLKTLCFHLDLGYDELSGETKSEKARELITYLDRRGRISKLLQTIRKIRPDISAL